MTARTAITGISAATITDHSVPVPACLALELGYYDHAHFIRDFRLVVGLSPAEYASEALSH
jgi:transcriptional regulator GlxA family with amidase domain